MTSDLKHCLISLSWLIKDVFFPHFIIFYLEFFIAYRTFYLYYLRYVLSSRCFCQFCTWIWVEMHVNLPSLSCGKQYIFMYVLPWATIIWTNKRISKLNAWKQWGISSRSIKKKVLMALRLLWVMISLKNQAHFFEILPIKVENERLRVMRKWLIIVKV